MKFFALTPSHIFALVFHAQWRHTPFCSDLRDQENLWMKNIRRYLGASTWCVYVCVCVCVCMCMEEYTHINTDIGSSLLLSSLPVSSISPLSSLSLDLLSSPLSSLSLDLLSSPPPSAEFLSKEFFPAFDQNMKELIDLKYASPHHPDKQIIRRLCVSPSPHLDTAVSCIHALIKLLSPLSLSLSLLSLFSLSPLSLLSGSVATFSRACGRRSGTFRSTV